MACATSEVFMDFNSGEKTEAVSAATLLYHGWDASRVCRISTNIMFSCLANTNYRKWPVTANRTHMNISNS